MLDSPGFLHRTFALLHLQSYPTARREAAPQVVQKLRQWGRSGNAEDRRLIEDALRFLADVEAAPASTADLVRELWSQAPDQVFIRWQLLALLGPLGQPGVDAFIDIYRESDAADREAYHFLQRANADTIQGLIRASRDPDTTRRRLAALLIEHAVGGQVLAEHRKALVTPACQLLQDSDAEVRHYALEAIRELAGEQEARATLPVIAQEMSNPESRTRFAAAHTLAAFGDIALEHIRQAAHSEQPGTRVVACSALSVMRPFPKDDIGLLLSLAEMRIQACAATHSMRWAAVRSTIRPSSPSWSRHSATQKLAIGPRARRRDWPSRSQRRRRAGKTSSER